MNEIRNTKYERRATSNEPRGFTLIELVVAIGVMAMVIFFAGVIFKTSITSYRTASAQAEIMQKFRAITDQLNSDFQGLRKDGYLILNGTVINRAEYTGAAPTFFYISGLYFFSTGDFQSWYNPAVRSNIARIYLGYDKTSLAVDQNVPVNHWRLAQDVSLLTPGLTGGDYNDVNFAWCQVNSTGITGIINNATAMFSNPPDINTNAPNTLSRLLCENVGYLEIRYADGTKDASGAIVWTFTGWGQWQPSNAGSWPKALKFTFTLYDSRGVFKKGQTFTHIVYIGD